MSLPSDIDNFIFDCHAHRRVDVAVEDNIFLFTNAPRLSYNARNLEDV